MHEIQSAGGQAAMTLGNLTTDDGASHVAQEALLAFDRIDLLINNAGAFPGRGWTNATPDQWLELYNLNVVSRVRLIQQLIPQMKRLGWGRVVQIAAAGATQPMALLPDTHASNAANINMTVSLAKEYLVLFVFSPLSNYINGTNLRVDGGYVKSIN